MKDYTSSNPIFSESIKIVETTDPAHADNVNEAPEQLLQNTLYLMQASIEQKAELDKKLDKNGDTQNNVVTFTSDDSTNPTGWADIVLVASKETLSSLMRKFSLTVKNIRYLYKMLGTTDISTIGGGTVTGAISALNSNLEYVNINDKFSSAELHINSYVENGMVVIYVRSNAGAVGVLKAQLNDLKYAPRITAFGIYSPMAMSDDKGKYNSSLIQPNGEISIWFSEALSYAEDIMFCYPIKWIQ